MTPFGRPVVPTCTSAGGGRRRRRGTRGSARVSAARSAKRSQPSWSRADRHPDELAARASRPSRVRPARRRTRGPSPASARGCSHLGGRQPPVDRHGRGAEVVGGEDRREEVGAVVGRAGRRRRRPGCHARGARRRWPRPGRPSPRRSGPGPRRRRGACRACGRRGARARRPSSGRAPPQRTSRRWNLHPPSPGGGCRGSGPRTGRPSRPRPPRRRRRRWWPSPRARPTR